MSYIKQMQNLAEEYYQTTGRRSASTKEMARWAITSGKWQRHEEAALQQCAEDFAQALREKYETDPQGRRVRTQHAAKVRRGNKYVTLWADWQLADRDFIEAALKQRRNQIVGDCFQMKMDGDSYNENYNKGAEIVLPLDFQPDVDELIEMAKMKRDAA